MVLIPWKNNIYTKRIYYFWSIEYWLFKIYKHFSFCGNCNGIALKCTSLIHGKWEVTIKTESQRSNDKVTNDILNKHENWVSSLRVKAKVYTIEPL